MLKKYLLYKCATQQKLNRFAEAKYKKNKIT
jgi:hypothetical protein